MITDPETIVRNAQSSAGLILDTSPTTTHPDPKLMSYLEILSAAWKAAHPDLPPGEAVIVVQTREKRYGVETRIFIERKSLLELKYATE